LPCGCPIVWIVAAEVVLCIYHNLQYMSIIQPDFVNAPTEVNTAPTQLDTQGDNIIPVLPTLEDNGNAMSAQVNKTV